VPVAHDLLKLFDAQGRPQLEALVFPDTIDGHLRRQNWRRRAWIPALTNAGFAYFRPYDLRHTCATLLIYEGRTVNEVARHLGHADPGFTARTYAHVYEDAEDRRRVPIETAILRARVRAVFGEKPSTRRPKPRPKLKLPANLGKPTRGFEPRTPSLRVKCSTS
jgi:integrase